MQPRIRWCNFKLVGASKPLVEIQTRWLGEQARLGAHPSVPYTRRGCREQSAQQEQAAARTRNQIPDHRPGSGSSSPRHSNWASFYDTQRHWYCSRLWSAWRITTDVQLSPPVESSVNSFKGRKGCMQLGCLHPPSPSLFQVCQVHSSRDRVHTLGWSAAAARDRGGARRGSPGLGPGWRHSGAIDAWRSVKLSD